MKSLYFIKVIGYLSKGIFRNFPKLYFWAYARYKRHFDSYKLDLMRKYVRAGDSVVDVGAHIGFYTLALAELVGSSGKIFAFEPDPLNHRLLVQNTKSCPFVQVYNQAVGSADATIKLYLSDVLNSDHRAYQTGENRPAVEVEQVKLDTFFETRRAPPAFIKMDIQGYEYEALKGMEKVLRLHRPVVLSELWPWGLEKAGSSSSEFLKFFNDLGYEVFLVNEDKKPLELLDISKLEVTEAAYYDVFCLPKHDS